MIEHIICQNIYKLEQRKKYGRYQAVKTSKQADYRILRKNMRQGENEQRLAVNKLESQNILKECKLKKCRKRNNGADWQQKKKSIYGG